MGSKLQNLYQKIEADTQLRMTFWENKKCWIRRHTSLRLSSPSNLWIISESPFPKQQLHLFLLIKIFQMEEIQEPLDEGSLHQAADGESCNV